MSTTLSIKRQRTPGARTPAENSGHIGLLVHDRLNEIQARVRGHEDGTLSVEANNSFYMIETIRCLLQKRNESLEWEQISNDQSRLVSSGLPEIMERLVGVEQDRAGKFKKALEEIREKHGGVCCTFSVCTHTACAASYASWTIADKALKEDDE